MLSLTLFVDDGSSDGGDGLSWETAFANLQAAFDEAATRNADADTGNDVDAIWIAEGTYFPSTEADPDRPRNATFSLLDGVGLYGGFAGTETTLQERLADPAEHETILSGDLGVAGDDTDNAYTVVYCGEDVQAELNGVTVTGGNADANIAGSPHPSSSGGGIFNHGVLTLVSTTVTKSSARWGGGGICSSSAELVLHGSTVSNNSAETGGGIYDASGLSTLASTVVQDNTALSGGGVYGSRAEIRIIGSALRGNVGGSGAGIRGYYGTVDIINSTLLENTVISNDYWRPGGGAVYSDRMDVNITNSTIVHNSASSTAGSTYGGGIYAYQNAEISINNSIIAQNEANSSNDIYVVFAGLSGANNLISDGYRQSAFVHGVDGNLVGTATNPLDPMLGPMTRFSNGTWGFYPLVQSRVVDAGDSALAVDSEGAPLSHDASGAARIQGETVDMGAVEGMAPFALGQTYVVTSLADTVDPSDGELTFIEAFQAANDNQPVGDAPGGSILEEDVIQFADGLQGTVATAGAGLTVFGNLRIAGPGAELLTFDGGGSARVFDVFASGRLVLEGVTVANGAATEGGAIRNAGDLTLIGAVLTNNEADENGGAIFNDGGSAHIVGTLFETNGAESGGAIFNEGGSVTVANATLVKNTATDGGGIFNGGEIALSNSVLWGNPGGDLSASGGVLGTNNLIGIDPKFADFDGGDYTLTAESPAIDYGKSDLVNGNAGLPALDEDLAGNPRVLGAAVDVGAYEFWSSAAGGHETPSTVVTTNVDGFNRDDGMISLREAIFYASSDGADVVSFDPALESATITLDGAPLLIDKSLMIDGESVEGLTINGNGSSGVFFILGQEGRVVDFQSFTITGGDAVYGGGVHNSALLDMRGVTVVRNAADYGAGLYNARGTMTLANSTVAGNVAGAYGGGIYNNTAGRLDVVQSILVGNRATYGGGLYSRGERRIVNSTLAGNDAYRGGGVYDGYYGADPALFNTIVAGNTATTGPDLYRPSGSIAGSNNLIGDGTGGAAPENGIDGNIVGSPLAPADPNFAKDPNPGYDGDWGTADDDYGYLRPFPGSQAINAGENAFLPADSFDLDGDADRDEPLPLDIEGRPRVLVDDVDIGAHEAAPGLYVRPSEAIEGDLTPSEIRFSVALYPARATEVTVDYAAADGTAVAGDDYSPTSGSLTFPAGETILAIDVPLHPDWIQEADETFLMTLSGSSGPDIVLSQAFGTIRDDDGQTYVVDSLDDNQEEDGRITLREAIRAASQNAPVGDAPAGAVDGRTDRITFSTELFEAAPATIVLDGNELVLEGTLVVFGPGADLLTLDADRRSRVFNADSGLIAVHGMTIARGETTGCGGGVLNNAELTLNGIVLADNHAEAEGGAVINQQSLMMVNGLLAGNTASTGGAISNRGDLTLVASTLSGNEAEDHGGGLYATGSSAPVTLHNTIIAGNVAPSNADVALTAGYSSGTYNLLGDGSEQTDFVDGQNGNRVGTAESPLDPRFVRDPNPGPDGVWHTADDDPGDPRLRPDSMAVDAGDTAVLPSDTLDSDGDGVGGEAIPLDLVGSQRVFAQSVDIGAFETVPGIYAGDIRFVEGNEGTGSLQFQVYVYPAQPTPVVVEYATQPGTATAGVDYEPISAALTIDAGSSSGTISVPVYGDWEYESHETFSLTVESDSELQLRNDVLHAMILDEDGRTYVVDSLDDTVAADGLLTLREALEAANTNVAVHDALAGFGVWRSDHIRFADALFENGPVTLKMENGQFAISDTLTIIGPGAESLVLDAGGHSRVFAVAEETAVEIEKVGITGGNANLGGGIENRGTLTLREANIFGNNATNGGGIHNYGYYTEATLNVYESTICRNTSTGASVLSDSGGGIRARAFHGRTTVVLVNSEVIGNSSASYGGGIANINDGDEAGFSLINCVVERNTAEVGGGIYDEGGDLTLQNVSLSDNVAAQSGGGIMLKGPGHYLIVDSTVARNVAQGENGGAGGGGILVNGGTVTIHRTEIIENTATSTIWSGGGGGIYLGGGGAVLTNSTIGFNSAFAGGGSAGGGGVQISSGRLWVSNSTIVGNEARSEGRQVWGGAINAARATCELWNSTVTGNFSSYEGGGIANGQRVVLRNSIVAGNVAPSGPDLQQYGETLNGFSCLIGDGSGQTRIVDGIDGNLVGAPEAPVDARLGDWTELSPGLWGYYLLPDSPAINAGDNELAVDAYGNPFLVDQAGHARILDGTVDIGATETVGGPSPGITYVVTSLAPDVAEDGLLTFQEALLAATSNRAQGDAPAGSWGETDTIRFDSGLSGTILAGGSPFAIHGGLTVEADGEDRILFDGASQSGVFTVNADANVLLCGLTITGGSAESGGAIRNLGNTTLESVTLRRNEAENGGAIHNRGEMAVVNSTLIANSASANGGAVYNEGSLDVAGSVLIGNVAAGNGAGIAQQGGDLRVVNSNLIANSAAGGGGGIDVASDSEGVVVNNTLFVANAAPTGPDLRHASDSVAGGCNLLSNGSGQTVFVDGIDGNFVGTAEQPVDPRFLRDPEAGRDGIWGTQDDALDMRLWPESPAVDAGDSELLPRDTLDLDGDGNFEERLSLDALGNARIAHTAVDMGAYETRLGIHAKSPEAWEGDEEPSTIQFVVAVYPTRDAEVSVEYFTEDGSADSVNDYFESGGTLTIPAGETIASIEISLRPDIQREEDETFSLVFLNAVGADIAVGRMDGLIRDEDGQIVVVTSLDDTVAEDGEITLREAVQASCTNAPVGDAPAGEPGYRMDHILFAPELFDDGPRSLILTGGRIEVSDVLHIAGPGPELLSVDGNEQDRVFTVAEDAVARFEGFLIRGGQNNAQILPPISAGGAGISNEGTLSVADMAFEDNLLRWSPNSGGAIFNSGSLIVSATRFSRNTAYGDGGAISNQGTLTIDACLFEHNHAAKRGGAIVNAGTLVMNDSTFCGNQAEEGGGLYNYGDCTAEQLLVSGNLADQYGGGIANAGTLALSGFVLTGNFAGTSGGGLYSSPYADAASGVLQSGTISGNTAVETGGGIYSSEETALANSIVAFNEAEFAPDVSGLLGGGGRFNLIGQDPRFVRTPNAGADGDWGTADDDYGDLRLTAWSPAINAGSNESLAAATTADLDGNPRIFGGRVDLGAYEFQDAVAPGRETPSTIVSTSLDRIDPYDGLVSLREAAFYVETGQVSETDVTFAPDLEGAEIRLKGMYISLYDAIRINATSLDSLTVDAGGRSRVFSVEEGADAKLAGLNVIAGYTQGHTRGYIADSGAAIFNRGRLEIDRSRLARNETEFGEGGAIANLGTLVVRESIFDENTASHGYGGAIFNEGTLIVLDSTFERNTASHAGGIYSAGELLVAGTTFRENEGGFGGGIGNAVGSASLVGCLFEANRATMGAAVANRENGTLLAENCEFLWNTSENTGYNSCGGGGIGNDSGSLRVARCRFFGNSSTARGGAIRNKDGIAVVIESTIDGNSAVYGGGISVDDEDGVGSMTVINTVLRGNSASYGGGVYLLANDVTLTNCTVVENSASSYGGGVEIDDAESAGWLYNTVVAGNVAPDGPDIYNTGALTASYNVIGDGSDSTLGLGGGWSGNQIGSPDAPLDPLLSDWTLREDGHWGYYLLPGSPLLDAGSNAKAVDGRGDPLTVDAYGNPRVGNDRVDVGAIEGASSVIDAGTVYLVTSLDTTIAVDGTLTFWEAYHAATQNQPIGDAPAGSYSRRDTIRFAEGLSGTVLLDGHALQIEGDLSLEAPEVDTIVFDADLQSGILEIGTSADVVLSGLTLTRGTAVYGGAIHNRGVLTLENMTLTQNVATRDGGAISNYGVIAITASEIRENSAANGGGMVNYEAATIADTLFVDNVAATDGGALFNDGTTRLDTVVFRGNEAGRSGGGLMDTSQLSAENVTFSENVAANDGGGARFSGTSTLINCTFRGNHSAGHAGGMYSNGTLFVANTTISENTVGGTDGKGGGIYCSGHLTLVNSTVTRNSLLSAEGAGGGIYSCASYNGFVLRNSIVAGNTSESCPDIRGSVTGSDNLIGDGSGQSDLFDGIDGNRIGTSESPLDPMLAAVSEFDNGQWGYYPLPGSPVIDAGSDTVAVDAEGEPLAIDQSGAPRIGGATVDIGAVEFATPPGGTTYLVTSLDRTIAADGTLTFWEAYEAATRNRAVGDAPAGSWGERDTIRFAESVSGTILLEGTPLSSLGLLTIEATGDEPISIDAQFQSRVIDVQPGADVVFRGLSIRNGNADSGGGIRNLGVLTLEGCTVADCRAESGGGLANEGRLTVRDSLFTANEALSEGGGIFNSGDATIAHTALEGNFVSGIGGAICNSGDLALANCVLAGNHATYRGGGLYNGATAELVNCTLSANWAPAGAGIYAYREETSTTLVNTIVAGNGSDDAPDLEAYGDASWDGSHNLIGKGLPDLPFIHAADGNLVGTVEIPLDPMLGDWTHFDNGRLGFHLLDGSPALDAGNSELAVDANGDPIALDAGGNPRIQDDAVDIGATEGTATPNAGVTYLVTSLAGGIAEDGILTFEEAYRAATWNQPAGDAPAGSWGNRDTILFDEAIAGGSVSVEKPLALFGRLTIEVSGTREIIFDGEMRTGVLEVWAESDVALRGVTIRGGNAEYGGGILNCGVLSLTDVRIMENRVSEDGGGVFNAGTLSVMDSFFLNNISEGSGGGLFSSGPAQVTNSSLIANSADYQGGGIYTGSSRTTLTNATVYGNTASYGGGLYHTAASPGAVVNNTIIAGNLARTGPDLQAAGEKLGGAYNLVGDGSDQTGLVDGINGNRVGSPNAPIDTMITPPTELDGGRWTYWLLPGSAALDGGDNSLAVDPSGAPLDHDQVGNTRIQGDAVDIGATEGAAPEPTPGVTYVVASLAPVIAEDGVLTFAEALLAAESNHPQGDAPGGSSHERDTIRFADDLSGTIYTDGEGIGLLGSLLIEGAEDGEIVFDGGSSGRVFDLWMTSDVELKGITITGGNAEVGGGVRNRGMLHVEDVLFTDNWAADDGGAVYSTGSLLVRDCRFLRNKATEKGGGVYNGGSDAVILNSQFEGNVGHEGGGLYNAQSGLVIVNSTFVGNVTRHENHSGYGGGIYNAGSLTLLNSTLIGNQASMTFGRGGGIYNDGDLSLANTLLWDNDAVRNGYDIYNRGSIDAHFNFIRISIDSGITHGEDGNIGYNLNASLVRDPGPGSDRVWGTADDDYGDVRLTFRSPAVDAGSNDWLPDDAYDLDLDGDTGEPLPVDLAGHDRIYRSTVDIGAYEIAPDRAPVSADLNGDGAVDSDDLNLVRANWGRIVEAGSLLDGDAFGDGVINSGDLDVIRANWGTRVPIAAAAPTSDAELPAQAGKSVPSAVSEAGAAEPSKADAVFSKWKTAEAAWAQAVASLESRRQTEVEVPQRRRAVDLVFAGILEQESGDGHKASG